MHTALGKWGVAGSVAANIKSTHVPDTSPCGFVAATKYATTTVTTPRRRAEQTRPRPGEKTPS